MAQTSTERVRQILDFVEEQNFANEQANRLTDEVAEKLRWAGVIKQMQPEEFGGHEVHPVEFFQSVFDLGERSGSTGWVSSVVGVHAWELAQVDHSIQKAIWVDGPKGDDTWAASPYMPNGRLKKTDGGYIANGRWQFSSGTDHCDWIILGAVFVDDDGAVIDMNKQVHIIAPRTDYEIVQDSWDVFGLAGTGSKDIVFKDVFLPDVRVVDPGDFAQNVKELGRDKNPLYKMPLAAMFSGAIAAGSLGIAGGALREFVKFAQERVDRRGTAAKSDPYQLEALGAAAADIAASKLQFLNDLNEFYDYVAAGNEPTVEERLTVRRNQVRAVRRAKNAVDELFLHAGGGQLQRSKPLQVFYRDMQAAMAHGNNVAEPMYEAWGKNLFGLDIPAGIRY